MMTLIKKNRLLFMIGLVYIVLLIVKSEMAIDAFGNSGYYLIEMFQILPVIFMITVAIDVLVPKEWIIKRLGNKSGILGSVLALAFGSISAGPIYAAFPIAKMLHTKGASVNNIVIILSAWAVIKVPMLANEAKFLGADFMLVRWVLTVLFIFFIGWLMGRLKIRIEDDVALEEKQLYIKEEYCIGCGACQRIAPEFYTMENGKARFIVTINDIVELQKEKSDLIRKTAEICPSKAIIIQEFEEELKC